jgi:hypothetical protein
MVWGIGGQAGGRGASAAIRVLLGAALALIASTNAAPSQPPKNGTLAEPSPAAAAAIEGFRSARWGMSEAGVKAAIARDFGIAPGKVSRTQNGAERTTILTVAVPNLVDGAGMARISYILGYRTRRLIQVTILWGTPVDTQVSPENVVAAANQLRQLFLDSGYEARTIVANSRLADGSILVFEGEDTKKHMTLLRLASSSAAAKGAEGKTEGVSIALSLNYILDGREPDIFRLRRGQF